MVRRTEYTIQSETICNCKKNWEYLVQKTD